MSETITCPVCNSPVEADSNECPRCGFKFAGVTQEYSAVNTGGIPFDGATNCGKPHLTVTKGPLAGEVFFLDPLPVTIGRDPDCGLFLNNMTVSREHAIIERHDKRALIRDCGSLNGTWVDGKVIDEAELAEGSLVQIGIFSMRFSCK
ncbi:MAG: FHA domain-containing protein [Coriobacteriales bacterium]|jgi:pSer/pThr/pTyr-binding forkhead associated (FHA) protein|nr:FHA domain-containing protein [Coriobacteriales bacterium]